MRPMLLMNPLANPNPGRSAALAGGAVGLAAGYLLTENATGVILGMLGGMVLAPLLTGTPPDQP